jgi:hypothetical protein
LEFGAGLAVGGGSATLSPVVPEPTAEAALLIGSRSVFNGEGGSGTPVARGFAFAAVTVGFASLVARWAGPLSRAPRGDGFSAVAATANLADFNRRLGLNGASLIG